jgi:hypothetical protein
VGGGHLLCPVHTIIPHKDDPVGYGVPVCQVVKLSCIILRYNYPASSGSGLSDALSITPSSNACATCASLPTAIAIELALQ